MLFYRKRGRKASKFLHYAFAYEIFQVIVSIKYSVPSIIHVLSLKSKHIFAVPHYNARINGRCSAYWAYCDVPR